MYSIDLPQLPQHEDSILRTALVEHHRNRRSRLAAGLIGSPILKIAAEVRELTTKGIDVCNLTVGDFAPTEFPIPEVLASEIALAIQRGETNYPPSSGMPALRQAIADLYARRLGLRTSAEQVLVAAGARPLLYAAYRILVDPGERVVFPVPSWNNGHYCQIAGARAVAIPCDASTGFLPTAEMLREESRQARLLVLNSPCNPTGTMFSERQLADICELVVEENTRRAGERRPLFLVYDQVYWMLTYGQTHVHPVGVVPEVAPYTIYVDGISKSFAATGLRVGWAVAPPSLAAQLGDLLSHVGAWAPRAEQVAATALLREDSAIQRFHETMRGELAERLHLLYDGIVALKKEGHPVDATIPAGAMYLSARIALRGRSVEEGPVLRSDEDVRAFLLRDAGLAAIPFNVFGQPDSTEGSGWFRLSVGAVSKRQIADALIRLRRTLEAMKFSSESAMAGIKA